MENIRISWDGEATNDLFDKFEEIKASFKDDFGIELELIGTRPKDRG